tara:strand:- start:82 stop:273 length:192 start_codon:yes stop_codon:yes gene_type:complete
MNIQPSKDKTYTQNYYIKNKEKILKYQKEYYYSHSNPKNRRTKKRDFEFNTQKKKKYYIISFN